MSSIPLDVQDQAGWSNARKIVGFAAMVVGLALLALLYGRLAQSFPPSSDDATGVLEAQAFLNGNYLLHGWTVSNASFYTTDLPFYIIGMVFLGFQRSLLQGVPTAIYILTLALAVWLAGRGRRPRRSAWLGMAVTFVLVSLPSGAMAQAFVFSGYHHVGTTLLVLASFLALDTAQGHAISWHRYALFTLALTLAIVGDRLALWVAAIPVIIVCTSRILKAEDGDGPSNIVLLGSCFCAIVASRTISKLIQASGGFTEVHLMMVISNIETSLKNIVYLSEGILEIYRANFFGRVLNVATICRIPGLLGLGFVVYSVYHAFPARRTLRAGEESRADFLCEILSVATVVNLAAFVLGHEAIDIATVRYLVPSFMFGAVLAGRLGVEKAGDASRLYPGIAMLAIVYAAFFGKGLLSPPTADPFVNLADWLYKKNLKHGYGSFWASSITTVASENRVKVRAVIPDGERITPHLWMVDRRWYRDTPAHFLVIWTPSPVPEDHPNFNHFTIKLQTATHAFGPPSEISRVGEHTVLIWDKDLTACLKQPVGPRGS